MAHAQITDISDDILEIMFSYVPIKKRKNLTLVCKRFNDIIGSSAKLMNSFEIKWPPKEEINIKMILLESKRNYRKIQLNEDCWVTPIFWIFMNIHASSISKIELYLVQLKSSELRTLLQTVGATLSCIDILYVRFEEDENTGPMDLPNLKSLSIYSSTNHTILNYFMNVRSIKKFDYGNNSLNFAEARKVAEFLTHLRDLEALLMDNGLYRKIFDDDFFINHANLKLVELSVCPMGDNSPMNDMKTNFMIFIINQRKSLKILRLGKLKITTEMMDVLSDCESLKELQLLSPEFLFDQKIVTKNLPITKLKIGNEMYDDEYWINEETACDFLKHCPKVQYLTFRVFEITHEIAIVVGIYLKNLEKLKVKFGGIFPFTYPRVKIIDMRDVEDQDMIIEMMRLNTHVKQLILSGSTTTHPDYPTAENELKNTKIIFRD